MRLIFSYLSKHLLKSEPDNPGNKVALSNAYAASGRWDEVSYMRYLMKLKDLRKVPWGRTSCVCCQ